MKKFLMLILGISLFSIYRLANAGAFVMPVSMTEMPDGSGRVVQRIISWTENSNALNPCYGSQFCWVGPDVQYDGHQPGLYGSCGRGGYANVSGNCIQISKMRTMKEVAEAYNKYFPLPHNFSFGITNTDARCVGLFYINHPPALGPYGDGKLWPGSSCGKLPPVNQHCSINLPSEINHGSLSNSNLNGNKKLIYGTINCTKSGDLKLYSHSSTGEEKVYLNSSKTLYSKTLINNKAGWDGVNISVEGKNIPTSFTFTSELNSLGNIPPGNYSGVSVVLLSFQ